MTLDDFLANRPKAFNLSASPAMDVRWGRPGTAIAAPDATSVAHMIKLDIQAAIRHGVLPPGAKIRIRRGQLHLACSKVGAIRVFVDVWPGAVFDSVFTAWVLDGEKRGPGTRPAVDGSVGYMSTLSCRLYLSEQLDALNRIANRHNFIDRSLSPTRVGYYLTIMDEAIIGPAIDGLREERDAQLVGRCPRCKGKRVHECTTANTPGCMHCDDDKCGHVWVEKRRDPLDQYADVRWYREQKGPPNDRRHQTLLRSRLRDARARA